MTQITFSKELFKDDASQELKTKLETFYNKPEVNERMTLLANTLFPNDSFALPSGMPLAAYMLHDFKNPETNIDPHNLSAAILWVWEYTHENRKAPLFSPRVQLGLERTVGQLLDVLASTKETSPLKTAITSNLSNLSFVPHQGRH